MSKTITISDETWEQIKDQLEEKPKSIKILHRDGSVLYESNKETVTEAVEEAVSIDTNLENANLEYANFEGANLKYANLRGANLRGANLEDANFEGANLKYANLRGANLRGANLEGANTKYAIVNFSPSEYEQAKQFVEGLKY